MTALPDVAVGDTVLLVRNHRDTLGEPREVHIASVGRKYAYIKLHGTRTAFHRDTGLEKSAYTPDYRLFTPDAYMAHKEREAAHARLRDHTRSYGWINQLSADQATRIADILEEEA